MIDNNNQIFTAIQLSHMKRSNQSQLALRQLLNFQVCLQFIVVGSCCKFIQQSMQTSRQAYNTQRTHHKKGEGDSQLAQSRWELSNFEIIKPMGRGKFGEVVVAKQKKTDYVVAIKRMGRKQLEESNFTQQVKREIIIQSSINHPHLLKLFGYFWDQQAIYLILQYAPQGELYGLLKEVGKFKEQTVSVVVRQVCEGLNYLHSHSIIHRDIKPENILVSADKIKIADFGWSIYTKNKRQTICGTLDYLAPEMIKGEAHDFKVDVWGVGVLAYQLAIGKPPFQDNTQIDTYNRIIEAQIDFPSHVSVDLRSFIRKCLQKDPQRRHSIGFLLHQPFILKYIGSALEF